MHRLILSMFPRNSEGILRKHDSNNTDAFDLKLLCSHCCQMWNLFVIYLQLVHLIISSIVRALFQILTSVKDPAWTEQYFVSLKHRPTYIESNKSSGTETFLTFSSTWFMFVTFPSLNERGYFIFFNFFEKGAQQKSS